MAWFPFAIVDEQAEMLAVCFLVDEDSLEVLDRYEGVGQGLYERVKREVLVKEDDGWEAFFSTDPSASVVDILEAFADRAAIEQDFHHVKEVWGTGQQQVRNLWANIGVYHLNLWMHTLVELWAWNKPKDQICDRSASPWDDAARRPSHADRRKALCRNMIQAQLLAITRCWWLPRIILALVKQLTRIAI